MFKALCNRLKADGYKDNKGKGIKNLILTIMYNPFGLKTN